MWKCYLKDCPTNKERSSLQISNTMCEKNLSFISYVEMGFIEGACLKMSPIVSCTIAMLQPIMATLIRLDKMIAKVLQADFYWPTLFKDTRKFVMAFNGCQRTWNFPRCMKCLKVAYSK